MMKHILTLAASAVLLTSVAEAAPVVTTGSGSAVGVADHVLTFDSLTSSGISLFAYSEDGISVTVPDTTYASFDPFLGQGGGPNSGFHYGTGGNNSFVTISADNNATLFGVEFLLGHGQGVTNANVVWETLKNGVSTGFGTFVEARGTVVGWFDTAGFDELRVGAHGSSYTTFGQFQSIALDNLAIDLDPLVLPAPGAALLVVVGLLGLGLRRKTA